METEEKSKREGESKASDLIEQPAARVTGAIVLIGLGVFFLLSQYGILDLQGNWWAIFIALPALAMLYSAYNTYRREGHITDEVTRSLSGGIIVGLIAVLAAVDQWALLLPLLLIVIGVFVALGWREPGRRHPRH